MGNIFSKKDIIDELKNAEPEKLQINNLCPIEDEDTNIRISLPIEGLVKNKKNGVDIDINIGSLNDCNKIVAQSKDKTIESFYNKPDKKINIWCYLLIILCIFYIYKIK